MTFIKNILNPIFFNIIISSIISSIIGIALLIIKKHLKSKISFKINGLIWILFLISILILPIIISKYSIYNIDKTDQLIINTKSSLFITNKNLNSIENSELENFKNNINNHISRIGALEILSILYFCIIIVKILIILIVKILFTINKKEKIDNLSKEFFVLNRIKEKLKIKNNFKLIKTNLVNSAMISGLIDKKIIIMSEKTNLKDLECLLTHELCHFKRKDNYLNILLNTFRIFYFFNPFIIYCLNRIEKDLELATDELAIKYLDEKMVNRYCKLIVYKSTGINNYNKLQLNFKKSNDSSFVKERIDGIMDRKEFVEKRRYVLLLSSIILLLLTCCFIIYKRTTDFKDLQKLNIIIGEKEYILDESIDDNYKTLKANLDDKIIIKYNKNMYSLTLNTINMNSNTENNAKLIFDEENIEILTNDLNNKSLCVMKIKYKNNKEKDYKIFYWN